MPVPPAEPALARVLRTVVRQPLAAVRAAIRADVPRAVFLGAVLWLAIGLWLALIPILLPTLRDQRPPGPAFDDFGAFYSAASMVRDGQGARIYDLPALARAEASVYQRPADAAPALPYFNPPPFAAALVPLTFLPVGAAAAVFVAISVLLGLIALAILLRESELGYGGAWLALAVLLTYQAVQDTLFHGQLSFFLLFAFTVAYAAFAARRERLGGFALGLLLIKPNLLLLPLLVVVGKRRWSALQGFAVAAALWAGASALISGPQVLWRYPHFLLDAAAWDDRNGISIVGMFGWNAFVRAWVGPGHQHLVEVWSLALAVPTALAVWWAWRGPWPHAAKAFAVPYSALVVGTMLVNPHLYRQDMVLMFIPAFLLLGAVHRRARVAVGAAFLCVWALFLYHFALLRWTGWNVSVPVMAVLLLLATALTLRRTDARAPWGAGGAGHSAAVPSAAEAS
ncbi:MAG: glycosyltransferase 87 family protein [Dehalococcoidia bacterium]